MREATTRREFGLRLAATALGLALAGPRVQAVEQPRSAAETLHLLDNIRNPSGSFAVRLQLVEYRHNAALSSSTLRVYAKQSKDRAPYRNLVQFVAPTRDQGKLMLRTGNDLWFYDPASGASVRISPQQRLVGQVSNGDVMAANLVDDYEATAVVAETVKDAAQQEQAAYKLSLQGRREDVQYPFVTFWVREKDTQPIKAEYYTAEKRLLKTAYFRKFREVLGQERAAETVIIDGLDPTWITVLSASDYTRADIADSWLQRDGLPRFTGLAQ